MSFEVPCTSEPAAEIAAGTTSPPGRPRPSRAAPAWLEIMGWLDRARNRTRGHGLLRHGPAPRNRSFWIAISRFKNGRGTTLYRVSEVWEKNGLPRGDFIVLGGDHATRFNLRNSDGLPVEAKAVRDCLLGRARNLALPGHFFVETDGAVRSFRRRERSWTIISRSRPISP